MANETWHGEFAYTTSLLSKLSQIYQLSKTMQTVLYSRFAMATIAASNGKMLSFVMVVQ